MKFQTRVGKNASGVPLIQNFGSRENHLSELEPFEQSPEGAVLPFRLQGNFSLGNGLIKVNPVGGGDGI